MIGDDNNINNAPTPLLDDIQYYNRIINNNIENQNKYKEIHLKFNNQGFKYCHDDSLQKIVANN